MNRSINKPLNKQLNKRITFGSNESYLITDYTIKQNIIDYLYSSLNMSKHRFVMLNNINKLESLVTDIHYVSPSFKGFNYLLIFITLDNKKYCVAIDRRKLSYHKEQIDIKTVFMVKIHVKVSDSIFSGTIFDGKLIDSSNKFIFLIQDCFYLMGKKILDMEMTDKMNHLDNILKLHFINTTVCENFIFKLNKLYTYENLEELIKVIIPKCNITIQGLVFYPPQSGISIIHIEKKNDKVDIETTQPTQSVMVESKTYDLIYNFVDYLKARTYSYEKGNKTRQFYLCKSNIPDVYNYSEKENGERLGIVHIPSIKISHLCVDNIGENQYVKFNCVYHTKFKKWIPVNLC
jgi:hypothetical protein